MLIHSRCLLFAGVAAASALLLAPDFARAQTSPPMPTPPPAARRIPHPIAVIATSKGPITVILYPEEAPRTVQNFLTLVKKGFYNNLKFHRVEDWVAQGGDPKGDGSGGPGYTIPDERNHFAKHVRGALAMAKTDKPDSAGSQFYFVLRKPAPHLDGNYTVFGQIISGMKTAESLSIGDTIKSVTIRSAQ